RPGDRARHPLAPRRSGTAPSSPLDDPRPGDPPRDRAPRPDCQRSGYERQQRDRPRRDRPVAVWRYRGSGRLIAARSPQPRIAVGSADAYRRALNEPSGEPRVARVGTLRVRVEKRAKCRTGRDLGVRTQTPFGNPTATTENGAMEKSVRKDVGVWIDHRNAVIATAGK